MAKRTQAKATPFQLRYECVLGIASLSLIAFHIWISFARHFFAPENAIGKSKLLVTMLNTERFVALALIVVAIIYLIITKMHYPKTWYRIQDRWKGLICKENILLLCLFAYYILCCMVNSKHYTNVFRANDLYLFDMAISVMLLFPMANFIGYKKMRKFADIILHGIMLFSTCFILWALWNLFHLNIVQLPNGLSSGMTSKYTFYPGVNQNIAAAIGTTMIMISLYMIICHRRALRIVYIFALLVHLTATLLTDSRGNFVALLVALPAVGGMTCWNRTKNLSLIIRVVITSVITIAIACIIWILRHGIFTIFESITHLNEYLNSASSTASAAAAASSEPASGQRSLKLDAGRIKIWRSTLKILFSSSRTFFFGIPIGRITAEIKSAMVSIYGSGKEYAHAHNMVLQTGLVTGVPGMLMFLAYLVMMLLRCIRTGLNKIRADFPGAYVFPIAILAMVIVNTFEPFILFYISVMGCLFFLFCGWTTALDRAKE